MAEKPSNNRVLLVNGMDLTQFPSNYISTTKYNLYNFLPLSLFYQFRRIANIYFLATAILQSIPEISPLHPFSAIAPLVFVLGVSMIREGIEDYLRYRSDKEINSTLTRTYRNGKFEETCYKDVQVGNLVLVHKNEVFPSDLVMLSNSNDNGIAMIETSTLDGEKNLKPRTAFAPTQEVIRKDTIIRLFTELECEPPNPKIGEFGGKINYNKAMHSLDKNQLLLSGAFLRNTAWAIGISVYTGDDTKLRQNLMPRRFKQSNIEHTVNRYIVYIIIAQAFLCLFAAVAHGLWTNANHKDHWYMHDNDGALYQGFLNYFTYFLLLNTMLPISLIISLELVKMAQGFCMESDPEMYSELRGKGCKVSSFSLNEELGMIQHIFSDKTGTLTCNKMEFKYCSIGLTRYGDYASDLEGAPRRRPTYVDRTISYTFDASGIHAELFRHEPAAPNELFPLKAHADGTFIIESQQELVVHFMKCLSLCHECLAEHDEEGKLNYVGQSPDEIALVDSARWIGFSYIKIKQGVIKLEVKGAEGPETLKFEKFCVFEFNSDRKRNSIVVKDLQTDTYFMYIKGADNYIFRRLSTHNDPGFVRKIDAEVEYFSMKGLRTLLIAFKVFSREEFEKFSDKYRQVSLSLDQREEKLAQFADDVEQELFLLGCTAVEDALQAEVPACIADFLDAGINVWMLTGDKMETAENIGRTCSLLSSEMLVRKIKSADISTCHSTVLSINEEFKENARNAERPTALIAEGDSLDYIVFNENDLKKAEKFPEIMGHAENLAKVKEIRKIFFELAGACKTIICCRATPGHKREVVKAMKDSSKCITLAVGDGANDVPMILEAHIGIGLYGEEGLQSVQASDYAVGEFRFLWDLLFIHGRYNYIRQSEMIMYFFYKNLVFTLPQFIFMFFCAFSGQTVYDDWYITFYNLVFTAIPLLMRALFDVDIIVPKRSEICPPEKYFVPVWGQCEKNTKIRKSMPKVYAVGRKNEIFTGWNFSCWMLTGILHSLLVFALPFAAASEGVLGSHGHNHNLWTFSITSFSCVILVVNLKLALYLRNWNLWIYIAMFLTSILLFFSFIVVYDGITSTPAYLTLSELLGSYYFYSCIVLLVSIVMIVDGGARVLRRVYRPTPSELLMDYSMRREKANSCIKYSNKYKSVGGEERNEVS